MASDWRPKTPQIEIDDRKSVVIEGCRRICEYENEAVKVNVGKYNVRVIGKDLRIKNLVKRGRLSVQFTEQVLAPAGYYLTMPPLRLIIDLIAMS